MHKAMFTFFILLLILSPVQAPTLSTFSDGTTTKQLVFPAGGGTINTVQIKLSKNAVVTGFTFKGDALRYSRGESNPQNILIYALTDYDMAAGATSYGKTSSNWSGGRMMFDLRDRIQGHNVDYAVRNYVPCDGESASYEIAGLNLDKIDDLSATFTINSVDKTLGDYDQLWIIQGYGYYARIPKFSQNELQAIKSFRNDGGNVLLSSEDMYSSGEAELLPPHAVWCRNPRNPQLGETNVDQAAGAIVQSFDFYGDWDTLNNTPGPITIVPTTNPPHPFLQGVNTLCSSSSDAYVSFNKPGDGANIKVLAKHQDLSYLQLLEETGKGRLVFDNTWTRFVDIDFIPSTFCSSVDNVSYQQNVADYLAGILNPPIEDFAMDVGNNGSNEFGPLDVSGFFTVEDQADFPKIVNALNSELGTCTAVAGECIISLAFSASTDGTVDLSNLSIEYSLPPAAEANGPYLGNERTDIGLIGECSDADGTIASCQWSAPLAPPSCSITQSQVLNGRTASNNGSINCRRPNSISFPITLTAVDNDALTGSDNATVSITDSIFGNLPPVADAGGPYSGNSGTNIILNGECRDSDGTISSCAWTHDGGASCSLAESPAGIGTASATNDGTINCTFAVPTAVTVTLTATDDQSDTGTNSSTATITVGAPLPSCTLSASPSSGTGLFSSTLTATFQNVDEGTNIDFDCGNGDTGNNPLSGGTATVTCTYVAVDAVTTYNASADDGRGTSCQATVRNNPFGGPGPFGKIVLNVNPLRLDEANPTFTTANADVSDFGIAGDAYIVAKVVDAVTNAPVADIKYTSSGKGLPHDFDFVDRLDEDSLGERNYKLVVSLYKSDSGAFLGRSSVFFEVSKVGAIPVPEISLLLIPLLLVAVFFVLKKK